MKQETKFSRFFITELDYQLLDIPHHIFRVESNLTAQGIPDIYCCVNGFSFWVELKVENELSPMQWSWHKQHSIAGGTSFIIHQNKKDFSVVCGTSLYLDEKEFDNVCAVVQHILRQVEEDASIRGHKSKENA